MHRWVPSLTTHFVSCDCRIKNTVHPPRPWYAFFLVTSKIGSEFFWKISFVCLKLNPVTFPFSVCPALLCSFPHQQLKSDAFICILASAISPRRKWHSVRKKPKKSVRKQPSAWAIQGNLFRKKFESEQTEWMVHCARDLICGVHWVISKKCRVRVFHKTSGLSLTTLHSLWDDSLSQQRSCYLLNAILQFVGFRSASAKTVWATFPVNVSCMSLPFLKKKQLFA